MLGVHEVVNNYLNVPAEVRTAETAIDLFLGGTWLDTEASRLLVFEWANFGGFTVQKARGLAALLQMYRRKGRWVVTVESTNETTWVIRFDRSTGNG